MSRNWERSVSRRQCQEQHRQQEARRLDRERQQQASLRCEESFESRRHLRQVQQELKERQMESALLKAEEERMNREKQLEQEERMAKELARINYETQREERMRQYIKENSMELRELEAKLKSAYVNKERAAQIAEQEAMRFETMREEADFARTMRSEHERTTVEQQKLQRKRLEEQVQFQRELEKQLVERERKRQEAYEEFLKEKLMVDEIVRKIYEEDQMERQLKLEKVRATQQHIEEFKRQQAEWRGMQQEQMEAENRRIMEFASHKQHMEETRMAKIREKEEAKEQLHKILSEKIEEDRQQREEMERVREELYLEEQEEAHRQRDIEEMEKKIRQRLMMQRTCQEQMAFKEMRRQAEKEEEEAFRKMMMAKFAEDDRIEQMKAQKRRMKQLEHKREVEKLVEERRRQHEADMELEAKERAIEQEREVLRRRIVEEERQRLLKSHATKLLGYLPKKKGIHRCGKCRLNFLTYKEKVEHRTRVHKTFRKPKALEGLPPGTKVTIRASITGKTPTLPNSPDRSGFTVSSESFNQQTKPPGSVSKSRSDVSAVGKTKMTQSQKQQLQRNKTKHNLALRNLSIGGGRYTCIECNAQVDQFFSHFPMVSNCGACKYSTSCKLSIGNHMIRYHSRIAKNRVLKMEKKKTSALKFTLVCLTYNLLVDASGGDLMSKHLTDRPNHVCKVIQEKDMKAKDRVQLIMGQPATVLYFLTTAPVQKPKEMELKVVESVTSESVPLATVSQPVSQPMSPAGDQEKGPTEACVIAGSSEGQLKQQSLPPPAVSSSCTSDVASELCDESVANSESLEVREPLLVSESIPDEETREQQTKSE